jgi:hypothetical protein
MRVSSSVPKVIQQLLTSSSSSSCHFYPPLYLSYGYTKLIDKRSHIGVCVCVYDSRGRGEDFDVPKTVLSATEEAMFENADHMYSCPTLVRVTTRQVLRYSQRSLNLTEINRCLRGNCRCHIRGRITYGVLKIEEEAVCNILS